MDIEKIEADWSMFQSLTGKIEDKNIFLIILDLDIALTLKDRAIKFNQKQRRHLV